ncbi:hypothetical protein B0H13DRAFT_1913222 [Mycena leptocephala]|nr:hypothetical protein B0H13DRAFT_1913222 [Mycena leptocephala]
MPTFGSKSATFTNNKQKDHVSAKNAYERVPTTQVTAKCFNGLGGCPDIKTARPSRTKTSPSNTSPRTWKLSWYLLGRAYMAGQKYNKACDAYQQAISQYRDALDAYSRAIRINRDISEVWFDLESLCGTSQNGKKEIYAMASKANTYQHRVGDGRAGAIMHARKGAGMVGWPGGSGRNAGWAGAIVHARKGGDGRVAGWKQTE